MEFEREIMAEAIFWTVILVIFFAVGVMLMRKINEL
jgi:hypothetical protein